MSHDERDLYLRWVNELWGGRAVARDFVPDTFVGHWPGRRVCGPVELQSRIDETRAMFTTLDFAIEEGPFVDGDVVVGRWRGTGTQTDGAPAEFVGNDILRVSHGRFVEYWPVSAPVP